MVLTFCTQYYVMTITSSHVFGHDVLAARGKNVFWMSLLIQYIEDREQMYLRYYMPEWYLSQVQLLNHTIVYANS